MLFYITYTYVDNKKLIPKKIRIWLLINYCFLKKSINYDYKKCNFIITVV